MIGKWSVDRYLQLIRRWVILSGTAVLFLGLIGWSRTVPITLEAITLILIGWMVVRGGGGKLEAVTAGVVAGAMLGFASSIGRFVHHPTIGSGLNLIIETFLTAFLATLLTVSAGLITTLIHQQKTKT